MSNGYKVVLAALSGAIAGAVTGLLFAPKTGKDTRELLVNKSEDAWACMNEKIDQLKESHLKLKERLDAKKVTTEEEAEVEAI